MLEGASWGSAYEGAVSWPMGDILFLQLDMTHRVLVTAEQGTVTRTEVAVCTGYVKRCPQRQCGIRLVSCVFLCTHRDNLVILSSGHYGHFLALKKKSCKKCVICGARKFKVDTGKGLCWSRMCLSSTLAPSSVSPVSSGTVRNGCVTCHSAPPHSWSPS